MFRVKSKIIFTVLFSAIFTLSGCSEFEFEEPVSELESNGGDNLGDHTATENLNLDGNSIISSGRIGIGTDNPEVELHVEGQIRITGGAPGIGKVLTSDALGNATWENAGAAGSTANAIVTAAVDPPGGTEGDVYYNTTDKRTYAFDGSSWVAIGDGGAAATVPATGVQAGVFGPGVLLPANQLQGGVDPATQIAAGAIAAGVTIGAGQVTGAIDPTTQIGAGAINSGATLATSQLTGAINPATQVAAGTIGAGVLLPAAQISGGIDPVTQLSNGGCAPGEILQATATGFVCSSTSGFTDNLGDHNATTRLNLATNKLVGNGGTLGLSVTATGNIELDAQIRISGGSPGAGRILVSDATGLASWQDPSVAAGDNLGDHTATQALDLATNKLVGNGGTQGLAVSNTGRATFDEQIQIFGGNPGLDKVLVSDAAGLATWQNLSAIPGSTVAESVVTAAADPPLGAAGDIYYNTTDNNLYTHDGTSWIRANSGGTADAVAAGNVTPGTFGSGVLLPATQLQGGVDPATQITAGAIAAGVTIGAGQVTGAINPATQIGAGAINSGATLATSQLTGTINPATQVAAGTLGTGVLLPSSQISGSLNPVTQLGNGGCAVGEILIATASGFACSSIGGFGDNLGDHTATQALDLNTNKLVGNGGTLGLSVTATGNIELDSQIRISGGSPGAGRILVSDATGLASWQDPSAAAGDNLGDHTATQALDLATNKLVGNGGTQGLAVSNTGRATFDEQIQIFGGNPGLNRVLVSDATGLASWQDITAVPGSQTADAVLTAAADPDPATASAGDVYYNTTDNNLYTFDGAAWVRANNGGTADAVAAGNITPGTFGTGVLLPVAQLSGALNPATQIAAGTLGTGVLLPSSQISGSLNPVTQLSNGGCAVGEILIATASGFACSSTGGFADNLGNHTATQALDLATNKLVGNGGTQGLAISNSGVATFDNQVQISGGSPGLNKVLVSDAAGLATWQDIAAVPGSQTADAVVTAVSDPPLGQAGDVYYNTTDNNLYTHDGTSWSRANNGGTADAVAANNVTPGTFGTGVLLPAAQISGNINPLTQLSNGGCAVGEILQATASGFICASTGSFADNLGNHTATQAINLDGNFLSGDGDAEGVFVSLSGLVGIGTAAPTTDLDVEGQVRITGGSPALGRVLTSDAAGLATWQDVSSLPGAGDNLGDHTATQALDLADNLLVGNGGSSGIAIDSAGNVGIGNTAPLTKLHIQGANNVGQSLVIDHTGASTKSALVLGDLTTDTNDTGIFLRSLSTSHINYSNDLEFSSSSNVSHLFIDGSTGGNVGIGTSAPTSRLDVNGQIRIRGGAPGAGKVLISDADGLARWENPGAATGDNLGNHTASQALDLSTNKLVGNGGTNGLAISATGRATFDEQVQISGGSPGLNKVLVSDAAGLASWQDIAAVPGSQTAEAVVTAAANPPLGAAGDVYYNTTDNHLYAHDGTSWSRVNEGGTADAVAANNVTPGTFQSGVLLPAAQISGDIDPLTQLSNGGCAVGEILIATASGFVCSSTGGFADNLGNHEVAQNLDLNTFKVVGNNGTLGLAVTATGNLELDAQIRIAGGSPAAGRILVSDATGLASWQDPGAAAGDNLGDHNATTRLNLGTNKLVGNGGTSGIAVSATGRATFDEQVQISGGSPAVGRVLASDATGLASWQDVSSLPGAGDDLGDHTATQALDLATNKLVGNGGTQGVAISATGRATFDEQIQISGGSPGLNRVLVSNATGLASWQDPLTLPGAQTADSVVTSATDPNPATADEGDVYYNTTDNNLYTFDGTTWVRANNGGTADAVAAGNVTSGTFGTGVLLPAAQISGDIDPLTQLSNGGCAVGEILQATASGFVCASTGSFADNLGSHTATQAINLDGNFLSGDGDAEGVFVSLSGLVGVGTAAPTTDLDVDGQVRIRGGVPGVDKVLTSDADGLATWRTISSLPTAGDNLGDHTATQNLDLASNLLVGNGGSSGVAIDSTGNVGIGTTSPNNQLHIESNASTNIRIDRENSSNTAGVAFYENSSTNYWHIGTLNGAAVGTDDDDNFSIFAGDGAGTSLSIDHSTGNVGIGTTAPDNILEVHDGAVGGRTHMSLSNSNNSQFLKMGINADTAEIAWDNADSLQLGVLDNDNTDTTINPFMTILNTGNVGVRTTAPTTALDVNGQVRIRGGAPAAGRVLVSDATGLATWQNPASLPGGGGDDLGNHTATTNLDLADNLLVGNGGTEGIAIDSSGNVGVGTASPNTELHVSDSTGAGHILVEGLTNAQISLTDQDAGLNLTRFNIVNSSGRLNFRSLNDDGSVKINPIMSMDQNSGNVGIGTTSPLVKLHAFSSTENNYVFAESILTDSEAGYALKNDAQQFNLVVGTDDKFKIVDVTSSQNRLVVDTSGNVGIGTTDPSQSLEVANSLNVQKFRITEGRSGGESLSLGNGTSASTVLFSNTGGFMIGGVADVDADPSITNDSDLYISSTGNVGIGTTNPDAKLEVNGRVKITGGSPAAGRVLVSDADGLASWQDPGAATGDNLGDHTATQNLDLASNLLVGNGGSSGVAISSSGNVGIGTAAPSAALEVFRTLGPSIRVGNGSQIANFGTDVIGGYSGTFSNYPMRIFTNSAEAVRIDSSGNVGVRTTAPTTALDVNGQVRIRGGAPAAGRVLVSDATGLATWQDPGAATGDNLGNHIATQNLDLANNLLVGNGGSSGIAVSSIGHVGLGTAATTSVALTVRPDDSATKDGISIITDASNADLYLRASGTIAADSNLNINIDADDNDTDTRSIIFGKNAKGNSAAPLMKIEEGGNVGIGTTAPDAKLDVAGILELSGSGRSQISNPVSAGRQILQLRAEQANSLGAGMNMYGDADSTFPGQTRFFNGNVTTMTIANDGDIGIGTSAPENKLHIKPTTVGDGLRIDESDSSNVAAVLSGLASGGSLLLYRAGALQTHLNAVGPSVFNEAGVATNDYRFEGGTDENLLFLDASTDRVGIGTNSPEVELDVNTGVINASAVCDENNANCIDLSVGPVARAVSSGPALPTVGNVAGDVFYNTGDNVTYVYNGTDWEQFAASGDTDSVLSDTDPATNLTTATEGDIAYDSTDNELQVYNGTAWVAVDGTNGDDLGNHTATQNIDLANNTLVGNGGTAGITINASGNIGIGATSPSSTLQIGTSIYFNKGNGAVGSGSDITFNQQGVLAAESNLFINSDGDGNGSGDILFGSDTETSASTKHMVIKGDTGNVGIGTTSPGSKLEVSSPDATVLTLNRETAGNSVIETKNTVSSMFFGSTINNADFAIDDDNNLGVSPMLLVQRSTGNVGIGTTSPDAKLEVAGNVVIGPASSSLQLEVADDTTGFVARFRNNENTTNSDGIVIQAGPDVNPGTGSIYVLFRDGDSTNIGSIRGDAAGGISYGTTSDRRLKKEIQDTEYGLTDLLKAEVKDYKYLDSDRFKTGFIAQDFYKIYPRAVNKPEDEKEDHWSIDYGQITPLIVKAVQELTAEVRSFMSWAKESIVALFDSVDSNKKRIAELEKKNQKLESELSEIKEMLKQQNLQRAPASDQN